MKFRRFHLFSTTCSSCCTKDTGSDETPTDKQEKKTKIRLLSSDSGAPDIKGMATEQEENAKVTYPLVQQKASGSHFVQDPTDIKEGSRVSGYCSDNEEFYTAKVTKRKKYRDHFFVEYDDRDQEWVDFHKTKIHLLSEPKDNTNVVD